MLSTKFKFLSKWRRTWIYLLSFSGLLFWGCGSEDPDNFIIKEYPLGIGNYWIYISSNTFHNNNGEIDTLFNDTVKVSVRDLVTVDGQQCYEFVAEGKFYGNTKSYQYYYLDGQYLKYQYYYWGGPSSAFFRTESDYFSDIFDPARIRQDSLVREDNPLTSLKFPLRVGASWTYRDDGTFKINKTVTGSPEISVEAGSFHCLEITYKFLKKSYPNEVDFREYFSPIGLVKSKTVISDTEIELDPYEAPQKGKNIYSLELIDYDVK